MNRLCAFTLSIFSLPPASWIRRCIKTPEGRILEEFAFQNTPHGHEELITHLRAYPQVQVAIESTGNL
jgi:hypothetical protein